jgi:hypothetical protein
VNKFLVWDKKFGPAQNILGPVKGQGNGLFFWLVLLSNFNNFFFTFQEEKPEPK